VLAECCKPIKTNNKLEEEMMEHNNNNNNKRKNKKKLFSKSSSRLITYFKDKYQFNRIIKKNPI
jgi:hypothetical protein